jgi:hypothetical protein
MWTYHAESLSGGLVLLRPYGSQGMILASKKEKNYKISHNIYKF